MKHVTTTIAAALVVPLLVAAPSSSDVATARVLASGDSVTSGWRGDHTWRYFFSTARPDVDMVGNKTGTTNWGNWDYNGPDAYADPDFDQGHAATYGGRLGDESPAPELGQLPIGDLVRDHQPTVVVGLWGINDLQHGDTPAELAANYTHWIADARSADPDVDVVIGALPQTWKDGVPEFNALLPPLADLSTATSHVVIAHAEDFTRADTADEIHPTVTGQRKIAEMMLAALAEVEALTAQEPPPAIPQVPAPSPEVPSTPVVATAPPTIARPAAPRRVRAVQHGDRVRVSWRAVAGAQSYAVRCGGNQRTATAPHLVVRTSASWCRVRAVNAAGASAWERALVRS